MTTISVWEKFSKRLLNFIIKHTGSTTNADDILQEVFFKVHKNLHQLKSIEKLESWLFRITRNVINDFYKKQGKELKIKDLPPVSKTELLSFEELKNLDFIAEGLSERVKEFEEKTGRKMNDITSKEAIEFFSVLCPFLEDTDPKYAQAVFLTDYIGMTQKDLASELGISVSGAKSRVQRGRDHLKNQFLQCCDFEFDKRGSVIHYERKSKKCTTC